MGSEMCIRDRVWDAQVTNAANKGYAHVGPAIHELAKSGRDRTGPTIFAPWVTPENPGGHKWGQGCLLNAPREGTVHTFIYDVSGIKSASLVLRTTSGESRLPMNNQGAYPSKTGAIVTADYLTTVLPVGVGDVRFYIEAEDNSGNVSRSTLERIFLA